MSNQKVKVENTTNSTVTINLPERGFRKTWNGKGTYFNIDKELLEAAMFDSGVKYMFDSGILYINDMEAKKELGLEEEEAVEPTNIIVLTEKQMERAWTVMPVHDFKNLVNTLSREQIYNLAQFAVDNKYINLDKNDIIQNKIGMNIQSVINLNREVNN